MIFTAFGFLASAIVMLVPVVLPVSARTAQRLAARHARGQLGKRDGWDGGVVTAQLADVLGRWRAHIMWICLVLTPPVLGALVDALLVSRPTRSSDAGVRILQSVGVPGLMVVFALALAATMTHQSRKYSDDALVATAVGIRRLAHQPYGGAGWRMRLQPVLGELERLEKLTHIFFSQRVAQTDEDTAAAYRVKWAGLVRCIRTVKVDVAITGSNEPGGRVAELAEIVVTVMVRARFVDLPDGDPEMVEGRDDRLAPQVAAVTLLSLGLAASVYAVARISDAFVPVLVSILASAGIVLRASRPGADLMGLLTTVRGRGPATSSSRPDSSRS